MDVQPGARTVVCQLLAGHAPSAELDAPTAAATAQTLRQCCWQVLPAVARAFPDAWRAHEDLAALERAAGALEAYGRLHTSLTLELADRFDDAGVDYVLLKSSAARFLVYERPELRVGWDIDLAVPPDQLARAERAARAMDFQPAEFDTRLMGFVPGEETRRGEVAGTHYELAFLVYRADVGAGLDPALRAELAPLPIAPAFPASADGANLCDVALDIHHALALDISGEVVFDAVGEAPAGRRAVRVPRPGALAFHLVFKLYWEGVHTYAKGLYQYADLARLVPALDTRECRVLIDHLETANLEVAGLFVLRRLPWAFDVALPEALSVWVDEVGRRPRTGEPSRHNDLGDVWPRLWGRFALVDEGEPGNQL